MMTISHKGKKLLWFFSTFLCFFDENCENHLFAITKLLFQTNSQHPKNGECLVLSTWLVYYMFIAYSESEINTKNTILIEFVDPRIG